MGLGSTTKKIQTLAERAEQMYRQMMELRDQMTELIERIEHLDVRSEKQWAVIQELADEQGIDVDKVLTEAAIEEVDVADEGEAGADAEDEAGDDAA